MSCVVTHEGSEYLFVQRSRCWVGHRRLSGTHFIGANIVAPLVVQQILLNTAIKLGFDPSIFRKPIVEKQQTRSSGEPRRNKKPTNSISIF